MLFRSWDEAMLANELQDLHADEIDLGLTGFDADELGKLLGLDANEQAGEPDSGNSSTCKTCPNCGHNITG